MAFTLLQAASSFRNPLVSGMLKSIASTNELISQVTFKTQPGTSYDVIREGALASVEWVDVGTAATVAESSSAMDQASFPFRQIVSDFDIANYTMGMTTPNGDPRAAQLMQKLKALGIKLQGDMINGTQVTGFTVVGSAAGAALAFSAAAGFDAKAGPGNVEYTHSGTTWRFRAPGDIGYGEPVTAATNGTYTLRSANASKTLTVVITVASATANGQAVISWASANNQPDGLAKLCPASQIIPSVGTNGDALSFDVLDALMLEKQKVRSQRAFIMNAKLMRKFNQLARTANLSQMAVQMMGQSGVIESRPVPAYNGVPILQVDDIPSTEVKAGGTTLSSVYLVSLDPIEGFFGAVQQADGIEAADVNLDPFTTRVAGLKLYDLGQRDTKAASGMRVEWVGGFGVGSPLAIARASELVTA